MRLLIDLQGAQTKSRVRGIGRLSRSLAKAMIARAGDHEVSLLLNGALQDNMEELIAEFSVLLPRERILTFQVPTPLAEHAQKNLWRMRSAEIIRETFIARHNPDVVFITSLFEGYLDDAVTSIGMLDAPHLTAVTLYDLIPLLNPEKYLAVERPRRHYLRRAQSLKRADLLMAISESARREAIDLLNVQPDRVAIMHAGVEGHFRTLDMTPLQRELLNLRFGLKKQFILYVGAVDPRKNLGIVLEAFAMLPPEVRTGHCLALAGALAEDERRQVRMLGARHGVMADELVFCGYVTDEDLVQLYNSCALFVFPSRHEGFGLPALESMACGAPTLVANSTSLPEIVTRDDLLFDPDKASELARKMLAILRDAQLRAAIREWGLARAAGYTWENCADGALHALAAAHATRSGPKISELQPRKKLAFLSPLPKDRSGVANYSTHLIKELARFYEIECIVHPDTEVTDEWIIANFVLRDIDWFERNSSFYERIVYSIGNSHFHSHMLGLLAKYPGVVLLHDFFLSDLIDWMANTGLLPPEDFLRELYHTHGLTGLLRSQQQGRSWTIDHFACNNVVFRSAAGVIVHSQYAVDRARELYGNTAATAMIVVPHLHAISLPADRNGARARLGIRRNDFVVCSFGIITQRKCAKKIVEAWSNSLLGQKDDAVLVFVGDGSGSDYGKMLEDQLAEYSGKSRIIVTGYASATLYDDYIRAADLAVQLRIESRGETSGATLDCMAAGVPVVINSHGTSAELPDDAVCKLPESVEAAALSSAMVHFYNQRDAARSLGLSGRAHIAEHHHPSQVGELFHDAIEGFARQNALSQQQIELAVLSNLTAPVFPDGHDLAQVSAALSHNSPRPGLPQILCDVTVLADQDSKTGIQRVVRSILMILVQHPPPGFRVEPIRVDGNKYRYARRFAGKVLGIPVPGLPDATVDYGAGDIYLAVDWVPDRLPQVENWLKGFRSSGGKVVYCIYDLLPLQMPQYFPDFMDEVTQKWFDTALATADQFACISRAVADDVERFSLALGKSGDRKIAIDYFHIGHDLAASLPSRGLTVADRQTLVQMGERKSFLMVGTVEPRKCHLQVIRAFDVLWGQGLDVGLIIIGKKGWMVDQVSELVARHPEHKKRLFWLDSASDEMLDKAYAEAAALIAASMGEGFGLPLIEAANHKRPLIARDIPVFREVAGKHAFYFEGVEPEDLANSLQEWLKLESSRQAPISDNMPHLNWRESTDQLLAITFSATPYKVISVA